MLPLRCHQKRSRSWNLEVRKRRKKDGKTAVYYFARRTVLDPNDNTKQLAPERVRLQVSRKVDAQAVIVEMNRKEQAERLGITLPGTRNTIPLAEAIELYLEHRQGGEWSESWFRCVAYILRGRLLDFMGAEAMVDQVTTTAVEEYRAWRRKHPAWGRGGKGKGRGKRSVDKKHKISVALSNRELAAIRGLVKWAKTRGWTEERLEVKQLREPDRAVKFCTLEEIDRLLEAARNHSPRAWAYCALGYFAGLRNSSIVRLRWGDFFHGEAGRWILSTSQKGNKTVELPMRPELVEVLEHYAAEPLSLAVANQRTNYLFPGRVLDSHILDFRKHFPQVAAAAGLEWVTPHVLRHSIATHMVDAEVPLDRVADFLGHRAGDLKVVRKHYEGKRPSRLVEAIDRLGRKTEDVLQQEALTAGGAACFQLANEYLFGSPRVERDEAKAADWFRRAAELGFKIPTP